MRRLIKLTIGLVILALVVFGLYIYKLHALAVESNNIFALRCTKVNPPLIAYKNSFLKFADAFQNPNKYTIDEATGFYGGYISGMRAYIPEETKWLELQRQYLDRWDFKLIEPWYIKQAADYQWKMYEGYRDDAKYILATFDAKKLTADNAAKSQEAKAKRVQYEQKYFEFFNQAVKIEDRRKVFSRVPVPQGCTKETLTIPNTSGAIDWEGKSATPSPAVMPVNPDAAS